MDREYVYYEFTNSLCNECLIVIPTKIIFKDEKVYLLKHCMGHDSNQSYQNMILNFLKIKGNVIKQPITKAQKAIIYFDMIRRNYGISGF